MELNGSFVWSCVLGLGVAFLLVELYRLIVSIWWRPRCVRRAFEKQGVKCLPYHLFFGNTSDVIALGAAARSSPLPLGSNDVAPRILPHYFKWKKEFGDPFVYWLGYTAVFPVTDPELIRQILSNKSGEFGKTRSRPEGKDLGGVSVATLEGEKWVERRRIVGSAFFAEKLKAMAPVMVACINATLERWESQLHSDGSCSHSKEIEVCEEFKVMTADIIATTAFGSSSEEGTVVFKMQQEQQVLMSKLFRSVYIPGLRFLPTANNRYRWRLKKQLHSALRRIIRKRAQEPPGNDLLGILMASSDKEIPGAGGLSVQAIVDECKTFFLAGHETTANLMTWTTMLLAIHQEWQERTREEVLNICGSRFPDAESLNSLKFVGLVINEALRLYPPGPSLVRQARKRVQLGQFSVPARTTLSIPLIALHHDSSIWGPDAQEFNPQRFANGVANCCKMPSAFFPFSVGPRYCVGQNFALLEAKLILTMMVQRFKFTLSPGYKHAPITLLTLQPQYGMQIIFEKIN